MTKNHRPNFGLERWSGLYLAAAMIIGFGLYEPDTFLTGTTLHSVAADQAVAGFIAIAVLIPLTTGTYDLTVGANANLSAVVVVMLQVQHGWSLVPAVVAGVVLGAVIGVVNGFIIVKLKVNSFIATLGMGTVLAAVQTIVSNGNQPFPPTNPAWSDLTSTDVFGFQIVVVYLLVLAVVVWWILERTPMGRHLYAIGSNAEASRLSGIAVGRWVWTTVIASGVIAGFAGVLYASLIGPSLTFGGALLLPAFAAVFLGSTQVHAGRANLWGTLIALYLLAIGVKGLQLATGVQWLNDMFSGVALIVAVSFAIWRQTSVRRARGRRERHGAGVTDRRAAAAKPDGRPVEDSVPVRPDDARHHHDARESLSRSLSKVESPHD